MTTPMKQILLEMQKLKNLHSGLGQFCLRLGHEYQKLVAPDLKFSAFTPPLERGRFGDGFLYPTVQSTWNPLRGLSSKPYDVWHCLHQDSPYLPQSKNTKLILTIHDLNFLEKYGGLKRKYKLYQLQKRVDWADEITVISKYTESAVRAHLDVEGRPIHVIPNGNCLEWFENPCKPSWVRADPFIFTIGSVAPKKNFHVLLPLLEANPHLHLIIAGPRERAYYLKIRAQAKAMNVSRRIHMPGPVDGEEKFWLYQNCRAFVFPSLAEGFGLPVVEAMSLGKPVFLSSLTSLPEVGGPDAYYWKSFDPQTMIYAFDEGMRAFDSDAKGKQKRITEWASQFSWDKAAKSYLKLYRDL